MQHNECLTVSMMSAAYGAFADQAGDIPAALAHYRRSVELNPRNKLALNNLADHLCTAGDYAEALDFLGMALDVDPNYGNAMCNAGLALWGLNRLEEAEGALRKAIALCDHPKAHMNLGLLLMTAGRYSEGFQEYNYRFQAYNNVMKGGDLEIWNGKEPTDKRLYVWAEQGLGDEILHFGGAQHLPAMADDIVWECDPRLMRLFKRSRLENVRFVPRTDVVPEGAELQIPAACISQLYAPWEPRAAYLKADPVKVAEVRASLPAGKRIVGISWKSINGTYSDKKSLSLDDFSAFLDNPDCHVIDLQYGTPEDHPNLHHIGWLDRTNDIDGLAAVISACDVVVTVSNSTAHLAGALGVPTIVRVSTGGGKLWYWGTGELTEWYASARIDRFERQPIQEPSP